MATSFNNTQIIFNDASIQTTAAVRQLLDSGTFSGASTTIVFDNTNYTSYEIRINNVLPVTSNQPLRMRTSTNGGSTFASAASDYTYGLQQISITPATSHSGTTTEDHIALAGNIGNASANGAYGASGTIMIHNTPSGTNHTFINSNILGPKEEGWISWWIGIGKRNNLTAINAIQLYFGAGNISSGTYALIGIS